MKKVRQPEDPVLSPREMAADIGVSLSTWVRNYRRHPNLELLDLSPRRKGARRSNWRRVVEGSREAAD